MEFCVWVNVVQAYMRMERFKLQEFTDRLTNGTGAYGIELSQHREVLSKTTVNSQNMEHANIYMNG